MGSIAKPLPMIRDGADTEAVRAEAQHNRVRVLAAIDGRPVPGPLTPFPAVLSKPKAPETARTARAGYVSAQDRVRDALASGDWTPHNATDRDLTKSRRGSAALFALIDSGEIEVQNARLAPDGSRLEYRLTDMA
jgi:hypothetical protein